MKKLFQRLFGKKERAIEIFMRHCHYSDVSAHKKRFHNFSREKCWKQFIESLGNADVNLTCLLDTHHPTSQPHFLTLQSQFPVVAFQAGTEAGSFLYLLDYVLKKNLPDDTILYFLEDDYLHRPDWVSALREAFELPGIDYVTLYDHRDKYSSPAYSELTAKLFHTHSCHWRTTPSTTNTYAMLVKTLKRDIEIHRAFSEGRTISADHEKFCKLSERGATLISALPGFSTHVEPEWASPCIEWEGYFR